MGMTDRLLSQANPNPHLLSPPDLRSVYPPLLQSPDVKRGSFGGEKTILGGARGVGEVQQGGAGSDRGIVNVVRAVGIRGHGGEGAHHGERGGGHGQGLMDGARHVIQAQWQPSFLELNGIL
jgi:hypothetical protein